MTIRRRKHWGWGFEDQQPSPAEVRASAAALAAQLGIAPRGGRGSGGFGCAAPAAPRGSRHRRRCRRSAPPTRTRAPRTRSASPTRTSCAAFAGSSSIPPIFVARPREEGDVERLLEWCAAERVAAIPFGGGTSVVGGVSPLIGPGYNGVVSIDLSALDRVLEVDRGLPRGAHPGRRARARARGPARRARADASPLSPVVRVLDAWEAGSPRARPATSRRCGRTSRTWSSRCGRSRRRASGLRGGCRGRAQG